MSATETASVATPVLDWSAANEECLQNGLARLRLLLERRILWLRNVWKLNLAKDSQSFQGMVITDSEANLLLRDNTHGESLFYERDEEARSISARIAEQAGPDRAGQNEHSAKGMPALEILSRLFRLGSFERDVLLLCLAPDIDPGFERLYAYIQDDANRRYLTPNVAAQILGPFYFGDVTSTRGQLWGHFSPRAPLFRFRLLGIETSPCGNWRNEPLRLDRRIANYLLGVNFIDEQLEPLLKPVEGAALLSSTQTEIVDHITRRFRGWGQARAPVVNLVSRESGSSRAIAREICAQIGLSLYMLDPARLPTAATDRQIYYRLLERESMLLPCAYFVDCAAAGQSPRTEPYSSGHSPEDAIEVAREMQAFLLIASHEPLGGAMPVMIVPVPKCDATTQFATWRASLEDRLPGNGSRDSFLARMVQQFQFGPQQIYGVVHSALESAALRDPDAPVLREADLWLAARGHATRPIEGLAQKIEARHTLEDLVLPLDAMQQIHDIASQVEQRDRVYEQWGFGAKLSRGRGVVALFAGPSGTGKTLAAEVLAQRLNLDLYRIDLSGVVSKYIGETEKNLKRVFDAAEESGAILFFDEADALFGKRSEVRDSHDRYANIEINYLLQRMEDYRGLAILATNRKSLLDQAFLRRLRFLVDFPMPVAEDRIRIWRGAFPAQAQVEALDFDALGRFEISGANISNIALNAAFLAAGEHSAIGMDHVLTAARREYSKIDKLMLEPELGRTRALHR
jgi:hypothetical protein